MIQTYVRINKIQLRNMVDAWTERWDEEEFVTECCVSTVARRNTQ